MRTPHYWKPARRSAAPANVIVLDCETWHDYAAAVPGGELQTLRLGVALAYRLEKGKRTRERRLVFREAREFWQFLCSRLDRKRPLWVVGHNLAYDWGVIGGWAVLCSDRFGVQKSGVNGSLFFLKGILDSCPVTLIDTFNYYRCSLASIGKSLGIAKLDFPKQTDSDSVWATYCTRDVDVTAAAFDNLVAFIREEKLGPWQPSIAGLAFAAYRCRFMNHKVLVHVNPRVLRLERSAYCGGIVDTPYVGRVPGSPVYEMDVCSMYPAVCTKPLPYRLRGSSDRVGLRFVRNKLENFHVIADVELNTTDTPYPVKCRDGTYYPVGQFRTSLAAPELEQALSRGHVRYVHYAAWYDAAPILADYMRFFVGKKTAFREMTPPNEAWATVAKYYANNLYGKTGQLTPKWMEWGKDAMRALEVRYGLPSGVLARYDDKPPTLYSYEESVELGGVPEAVNCREYYGMVEVAVGEHESRESCPAIAATVTSYARCLLRKYQATAGRYFYSDTDSVWVDGDGKKRLEDAGYVANEVLGLLGCKGEHAYMIVHGPKDYETDRVRRVKGVRANAAPDGKGGWTQLQFPSPLIQIQDGFSHGVFVRSVTKRLKREFKRCKVLEDGSTRPLTFPSERPRKA